MVWVTNDGRDEGGGRRRESGNQEHLYNLECVIPGLNLQFGRDYGRLSRASGNI